MPARVLLVMVTAPLMDATLLFRPMLTNWAPPVALMTRAPVVPWTLTVLLSEPVLSG